MFSGPRRATEDGQQASIWLTAKRCCQGSELHHKYPILVFKWWDIFHETSSAFSSKLQLTFCISNMHIYSKNKALTMSRYSGIFEETTRHDRTVSASAVFSTCQATPPLKISVIYVFIYLFIH